MNNPQADNARERAEQMQAEHDAIYGPDAQTPLARRNRVLLGLFSYWWWFLLVFAIGFATGYSWVVLTR
jgi:hypothetical protein